MNPFVTELMTRTCWLSERAFEEPQRKLSPATLQVLLWIWSLEEGCGHEGDGMKRGEWREAVKKLE